MSIMHKNVFLDGQSLLTRLACKPRSNHIGAHRFASLPPTIKSYIFDGKQRRRILTVPSYKMLLLMLLLLPPLLLLLLLLLPLLLLLLLLPSW